MGDFATADKQGASSLAQLVIKLNGKKFPNAGAIVEGTTYKFHIVAADANKHTISEIKLIKK